MYSLVFNIIKSLYALFPEEIILSEWKQRYSFYLKHSVFALPSKTVVPNL